MAEKEKRNVKATSQVTVRVTVDVEMDPNKINLMNYMSYHEDGEMDPNKLNSIQYMSYYEALMTLKNIHQALSRIKTKSKQFECIFSPTYIDIEKGAHYYRITCALTTTLETTDEDVCDFGKYEIDASIVLTTDSTGSLIADSSSELVKLVQDIETLCRELSKTHKYYMEDYKG